MLQSTIVRTSYLFYKIYLFISINLFQYIYKMETICYWFKAIEVVAMVVGD